MELVPIHLLGDRTRGKRPVLYKISLSTLPGQSRLAILQNPLQKIEGTIESFPLRSQLSKYSLIARELGNATKRYSCTKKHFKLNNLEN